MKIKAQATTMAVSVAVMASFLSGAVAFSQMQLIPDMFEKRSNDLDLMTRTESRADNTAGNFVTQAAWFDMSNITYHLGENKGVGISGENEYEGGFNTEAQTNNLMQNYFGEAADQLQEQFDGYSGNQLQYSKCDVSIDPDVLVTYDISNRNPELESSDSDGLVSVECRNSELITNYQASQSSYQIDMNNNRFPYLVKLVAAGMFKGEKDGNEKKGAEEVADQMQSGGEWSGGNDGYWNDDNTQKWGSCFSDKSDARDDARSVAESQADDQAETMKDAILFGGKDCAGKGGGCNIIEVEGHGPRGAKPAMEHVAGGSQICIAGYCSPEMPANIDWDSVDRSVELNDENWVVQTSIDTQPKYNPGEFGVSSCRCENVNKPYSPGQPCDEANKTYKAEASAKWYYDYIDATIKAVETKDANKIPTDQSPTWQTLTVKEDYYRDFPEPGGW